MDIREQLCALQIPGVKETGRELGRGAYGVVVEVDVNGLPCAAKKLHKLLFDQGQEARTAIASRYALECLQHSRQRHPNIVQLLGVHFQSVRAELPMMILEKMHMSLWAFLEKYPRFHLALKNEILVDVSRGLVHLHRQSPPIIHRDLTANNVLITTNLTAKIADLGMAKIINTNPVVLSSKLTQVPGTAAYMPPEAMSSDPSYSTKLDVFSFGVLILHTMVDRLPQPSQQFLPSSDNPGVYLRVPEVDRRKEYLQELGEEHSHNDLIYKCLCDEQNSRPTAMEVLLHLTAITAKIGGFLSRIEFVAQREKEAKQKTEGQNIQTGRTSLLKEKMELLTKVESLSKENQDLQKQLAAVKSRVQERSFKCTSEKKEDSHNVTCKDCKEIIQVGGGVICVRCLEKYKSVEFTLMVCSECKKGFKKPGIISEDVAHLVKCDDCAEIRSDKLKSGELVSFGSGDQMHVFPRCELEQIAGKTERASLPWYKKGKEKKDKKKK